MRILHHWPLDPWSRQVRLALAEKKLDFEAEYQRFWDLPDDLVALNPTGLPPVLVEETDKGRTALCETRAILEYLEETHPDPALLPRRGEAAGGLVRCELQRRSERLFAP